MLYDRNRKQKTSREMFEERMCSEEEGGGRLSESGGGSQRHLLLGNLRCGAFIMHVVDVKLFCE
jgi:hypothetical protein